MHIDDALNGVLERIKSLETLRINAKAEAIPNPEAEKQTLAKAGAKHEVKEMKEEKGSNKGIFDGWLFKEPMPKE